MTNRHALVTCQYCLEKDLLWTSTGSCSVEKLISNLVLYWFNNCWIQQSVISTSYKQALLNVLNVLPPDPIHVLAAAYIVSSSAVNRYSHDNSPHCTVSFKCMFVCCTGIVVLVYRGFNHRLDSCEQQCYSATQSYRTIGQ